MFESDSIPNLIHLLMKRDVHLYHACQYRDFCSYITLKGIPSRARLEQDGLPMTRFASDNTDKERGVWDKIFLNLQDLGMIFANGWAGVPNVYGPILFRFKPSAFYEASDVAVCLRSASAKGFNRERDSLKSLEDMDRVFLYPIDSPTKRTATVKFGSELRKSFGEKASSVEVSCTIPKGFLSFHYLLDIVVDPYVLGSVRLLDLVSAKAQEVELSVQVKERKLRIGKKPYQDILHGARPNPPSPADLARETGSGYLAKWAREIQSRGRPLAYSYDNYFKYLYEGTVEPVRRAKPKAHTRRSVSTVQIAEGFPAESIPYDLLDEEFKLLIEDIGSDREDWARSSEEGWPYSDKDDMF